MCVRVYLIAKGNGDEHVKYCRWLGWELYVDHYLRDFPHLFLSLSTQAKCKLLTVK